MSQRVVEQVKAELEAAGVDLSGPCGAFQIVKHVAWRLKSEGAGLLDKPGGNNCQGYAVDIVCFPDGEIHDCLGDSGGANTPMWGGDEFVDPSRYRPAFDPGPIAGQPPDPEPVPDPQPDPALEARIALLEAGLADLARRLSEARDDTATLTMTVGRLDARVRAVEARPDWTGCKVLGLKGSLTR